MITAEMIEQADSKHHMQFYETGKHGTTFEFGAPIGVGQAEGSRAGDDKVLP